MSVLKCISARNLKNTLKPSKNVVWRSKTTIFEKNVALNKFGFNIEFLMKCLDDSAWLCLEKLKNIFFQPKTQKKYQT